MHFSLGVTGSGKTHRRPSSDGDGAVGILPVLLVLLYSESWTKQLE